MVAATSRGLTILDFEELELGQIIDYIITYDNSQIEDEKESEKEAEQSNFDYF